MTNYIKKCHPQPTLGSPVSPHDVHSPGSWGKRPLVASRVLNCFSWHSPALWTLPDRELLYQKPKLKKRKRGGKTERERRKNKFTAHVLYCWCFTRTRSACVENRIPSKALCFSNTTSEHTSLAETEVGATHDTRATRCFSLNEHRNPLESSQRSSGPGGGGLGPRFSSKCGCCRWPVGDSDLQDTGNRNRTRFCAPLATR